MKIDLKEIIDNIIKLLTIILLIIQISDRFNKQ